MTALMSDEKGNGGGAELARFGQPTPYSSCGPQAATAAVEAAADAAREVADKLGSGAGGAWQDVVGPLDAAEERLEREYSLVAHMHAVSASPKWDEANKRAVAAMVGANMAIGQNRGLYGRLVALRGRGGLPAGRARILEDMIAGFELSGVALGDKARARFAANEQRLSQLGSQFEENLREATAAWSHEVTDASTLEHMPEDMRAAAKEGGGWRFSLLDPSYVAYMTHGGDRALREQMALARNARASNLGDPGLDNTGLVAEIVDLRWRQSRELGFVDPASMILSRRMAGRPGEVASFLARMVERARPAARRELAELAQLAGDGHCIGELRAWDVQFASERLRERQTGIADADVRPYFGAGKVIAGLFDCARTLFGVDIKPREGLPVWHESVQTYELRGPDGAKIGDLYLDLYARPTKRGGAWAHGSLSRCRTARGLQLPAALLNCNFTRGPDGAEARLGWQEVLTLFHEAGHGFHHLLTKVDDHCAAGMNGVEWDAVELPSQFMENFAWRPEVAIGMSGHERTGEPMAAETFAKLEAQRSFLPGLFVTRQAALASYDLQLHTREGADPVGLWREVRDAVMVTPGLGDDDRLPCSFGHIFAGGYATGYYGYMWADVLAADAYEMFTEPGADLGGLGRRFCAEVLETGGTRDAAENFRALRGRDPDPSALMRRLGI